ncbi:hypothetical protein BC833DRAFT_601862, partial [Globomyces pollinis-pini]
MLENPTVSLRCLCLLLFVYCHFDVVTSNCTKNLILPWNLIRTYCTSRYCTSQYIHLRSVFVWNVFVAFCNHT